MLNEQKLKQILTSFTTYLPQHWDDMKPIWESIAHFQKYWDIDAEDFGAMYMEATRKHNGLLSQIYAYPRETVRLLSDHEAESVRRLFRNLFDESQDLTKRSEDFMEGMELLRRKYLADQWQKHYQSVMIISVYLWMRYPDKYYVYQYSLYKAVSTVLEDDVYELSQRKNFSSMSEGYGLFNEINRLVRDDLVLIETFRGLSADGCYSDPQLKTLTWELADYIEQIWYRAGNEARPESELDIWKEIFPSYTKEEFLSEVYMTEERYDLLTGLLRNKKNVILQGAPGVGKTFTAKRLAYAMMGQKDDYRIGFVQFHQSYSYEEFIMGYRPEGEGYELKKGIFLQFCEKAAQDPGREYFFLIDEINRGNLSKIFGELLMLIEKDYRGTSAQLAYTGEPFCVPDNLCIIGMMNTADRSLAMIDYALRRRFSFFEVVPGFLSEGFQSYERSLENARFDELIRQVQQLNAEIEADESLGSGFCIGHSYFCGKTQETCTLDWIRSVVEFDLIPMISEYWFDDREKLAYWKQCLRGVCDDQR